MYQTLKINVIKLYKTKSIQEDKTDTLIPSPTPSISDSDIERICNKISKSNCDNDIIRQTETDLESVNKKLDDIHRSIA